jgi:hypothetical protein
MDKTELYLNYAIWAILIYFVSLAFNYFSTKSEKFIKLLLGSFFSSWFFLAVVFIIRDVLLDKFNYGLNLNIFASYMAESLPTIITIGLITFAVKYFKFKKRNKVN